MNEFPKDGQSVDFLDLQRQYNEILGSEGFDVNDLSREIKKLRILGFHLDREKKSNVVSEIDGKIVFVDRMYTSQVAIGDVWICSVIEKGTVYYATPLKKITAATAMDFSDNIREEIINALWETNKRSYVKIFEEKYKKDIYKQASQEQETKDKDIIESLKRKVEDLSNQLEQSRFVIESRNEGEFNIEEEITLGEPPAQKLTPVEDDDAEITLSVDSGSKYTIDPSVPATLLNNNYAPRVPGLPEIHNPELPRSEPVARKYHVERLDPTTLYSESFADGKYFVHINMSKKF